MLRLQSDERLVALVRRGHHGAFEALVSRYQSRLLAFCRHMLGSREDAEDVLQEVFAAAFNAMLADERPINVRPWLYRIARNRSLNHLRRAQAIGVDSMDVHLSENGATTADKVHRREDFRQLIGDVQELAETQRTALLLREIDALSYEQIAEAMETTVPSVKSLLVRARVSLAEAAEARKLTCEEVRDELGEVAEGLRRTSPPVRRHLRSCDRCAAFRKQLRSTNRALALVFPVAPLLLFKKGLLAQLGMTASAGAGTAATGVAAGATAAGSASIMSAGISTIATKTAASLAAAAIVTAGAVEVDHVRRARTDTTPVAAVAPEVQQAPAPPKVVTPAPAPSPCRGIVAPADRRAQGRLGRREGPRAGRPGHTGRDRSAEPGRRHGAGGRDDGRARPDAAGRRLRDAPRPAGPAPAGRGRDARAGRGRAGNPAGRRTRRACRARRSGDANPRRHRARADDARRAGGDAARGDHAAGGDTPGGHDAGGAGTRRPRRDDPGARPRGRAARSGDPRARAGPGARGDDTRRAAALGDPVAGHAAGVRLEQQHRMRVAHGAQHEHLGPHGPDLPGREVHDAHDETTLELLARVVRDLRAGALLPDLRPEVDPQLPSRPARLRELLDGDDATDAHVDRQEVVEGDLPGHRPPTRSVPNRRLRSGCLSAPVPPVRSAFGVPAAGVVRSSTRSASREPGSGDTSQMSRA